MAKVTINGTEHEFKDGMNLIDACESVGVDIPHYCYHPGLSIAGQCRMCYVEQEGNPKLQVACNMKCSDGLKITTNSDRVQNAVRSSLEFHLINHPIDCPICDQAGECGLQDYYMKYGKYESEMREQKVLKEKAVDLGDKIVLDKERCILCSRCVRFTEEVSKTAALRIYNRGDRSVIGTVNNEPMTDNYQINTVDICPVGALTSKDFRFEQRVWFLDESNSICGGCSKGCNIYVHHKKGKHIYRLKPRFNEEVNSYWMCDFGRTTYKFSNYDRRTTNSKLGGVEMPLQEAIQTWASDLRTLVATERSDEVAVWIHPQLTNEEILSIVDTFNGEFHIQQFFAENLEALAQTDDYVDQLLYRKDPYPNTAGLLQVLKNKKIKLQSLENLIEGLERSKFSHLIVFAPEKEHSLEMFYRIQAAVTPEVFSVVLTPFQDAVEVFTQALSIPTISHYEKNGSMINHQGKTQQLESKFRMFKDTASIQEVLSNLKIEYEKPASEKRMEASL